tara:strand:- start:1802 stop:4993 length:3192 start_codon:yes stop_codon:yes gene_type:complete
MLTKKNIGMGKCITIMATVFMMAISTTHIMGQVNQWKVLSYDTYGNPMEVQDANGNVTKYYYGSDTSPFSQDGNNSTNGVYLTGIQKVQGTDDCNNCGARPSSGDDLFTEARYDDLGRISSITDENEQETRFKYDSFGRLISTLNPNGFLTAAQGYGYSTIMNGGIYSPSAPNYIETISYADPIHYTDFSSSSGWSSVSSYNVFNYPKAGETTVRMGSGGGWETISKSFPGSSTMVLRVDFYPDNSTGGTPHVILEQSGIRFAVQYRPGEDAFRVQYRTNPTGSYSYSGNFPLDAFPNRWYTIEIQKVGEQLTAWVYPRGEGRSEINSYKKGNFISWTPTLSLTTDDNYFYAANLSIAKSSNSTVSYMDGLGREIQTQQRGGGQTIITGMRYNDRGLPEVVSRPIEAANQNTYLANLFEGNGTFTPGSPLNWNSPIENYYQSQPNNDEDYAYSHTIYEDNPLKRVYKSTLPGTDHRMGNGKETTTTYGLNSTTGETFTINGKTWGLNTLQKTINKDPDGKETITYTDGWGQTIVSGVNWNPSGDDILNKSSNDLVTYFEYDLLGNLVWVEDPRGLETTYDYNDLGQLEEKVLPDQDHSNKYRYDKKGQLRVHVDPNLSSSNELYYHEYDELGRVVETGIYSGGSIANILNDPESYYYHPDWPYQGSSSYVNYSYDGTNAYSGAINLKGNLTREQYKELDTGNWGYTWYSYNNLGLVEWIRQRLPGQSSSVDKIIEYTYDELGRLTRLFYNPSGTNDDHYFWYYYDELGRLEKIKSHNSNSESIAVTEAEYTYYADGQVKELNLGGGAQSVDYDYTVQGWLSAINDPDGFNESSSGYVNDRFGMHIRYNSGFTGGVSPEPLYNGNIAQIEWEVAGLGTGHEPFYSFTYDQSNRLTTGNFHDPAVSDDNNGGLDVSYSYDKNGNITGINRKRASSGYPYMSPNNISISGTSNRITGISYQVGPVPPSNENLGYDSNGNVTSNTIQGITSGTYDWRNLPRSVNANGSTMKYSYDADGNRIMKELVGGTKTWYVRGADGQTLAVYQGSSLKYINLIAGGEIIGRIEK